MKKIFRKVVVLLTIVTTGFSMTSCGSDEIINVIEQALNIWTNINAGETIEFTGRSSIQKWTWNEKNQRFEYNTTQTYSSHGLNLVVKSNQAAISVGDFTVEGYTISNLELSSVTYSNGNLGDVNEEGYVYGCSYSLTYNGNTTSYATSQDSSGNIKYPYAEVTGKVTNEGVLTLSIIIDQSKTEAFNIEYTGNVVTQ